MAPRAYWKGYLKLSLVSCPIALFPATSEREKISFHQLNKNTGHRIKYRKVDAESGDEVEAADIIKGYEVGKGSYIELDPEELEAVAIESKRTIDIEYRFPFGDGWGELEGIANRSKGPDNTSWDLFQHEQASGQRLTLFDEFMRPIYWHRPPPNNIMHDIQPKLHCQRVAILGGRR